MIPGGKVETGPSDGGPVSPTSRERERPPALLLEEGEVLRRPNGERYLPRDVGGHHDVAALRAFAAAGLFALLAGEPGSGKTVFL